MLAEGQMLRTQLQCLGKVLVATQQRPPGDSLPLNCSSGSVELARRSALAIVRPMARSSPAKALEPAMAI